MSEITKIEAVKIQIGNFGNGRYSPVMVELFNDSQRLLGFSPEQAHVTAMRIGVDAGQLNKASVQISYGKSVNKDGYRTLKEVTKGIKLVNSWAMSIGAICSMLDDARKQGLEVIECSVHDNILKFVNEAAIRSFSKDEKTIAESVTKSVS